jgi:hypothetical protein
MRPTQQEDITMHGLAKINRMNGMSNQERQLHNLAKDTQKEATDKAEALRKAFWITILTVTIVVITALTVV